MQFDADVLSPGLVSWCWILAGRVLLTALSGLGAVRSAPHRLHLVAGAAVALALLWSVRAGVDPGLGLHVLGITAVVLLLGWRLAMLAAALASLALVLVGDMPWVTAPAGWLLSAAVPGAVAAATAWIARFHLPRNPFVFIFVCAFFASGLALLLTWLLSAALLSWSGQASPSGADSSLLAFLPLVLFPEGFINGAIMSMLIVYRPDWVRLYDERFYIRT